MKRLVFLTTVIFFIIVVILVFGRHHNEGKLVFARDGDLWFHDLNDWAGRTEINLTNSDFDTEINPTWSPDGTQIAYLNITSIIGGGRDMGDER